MIAAQRELLNRATVAVLVECYFYAKNHRQKTKSTDRENKANLTLSECRNSIVVKLYINHDSSFWKEYTS